MSVIPLTAARPLRRAGGAARPASPARLTGSFRSPSGRTGCFLGAFRVEHCGSGAGPPAVAGVVTGELTDADGSRIGVGARRLTASSTPVSGTGAHRVRIGPLDVDLLGLLVRVEAFALDLPSTTARLRRTGAG